MLYRKMPPHTVYACNWQLASLFPFHPNFRKPGLPSPSIPRKRNSHRPSPLPHPSPSPILLSPRSTALIESGSARCWLDSRKGPRPLHCPDRGDSSAGRGHAVETVRPMLVFIVQRTLAGRQGFLSDESMVDETLSMEQPEKLCSFHWK